jgi:hypothetical protein
MYLFQTLINDDDRSVLSGNKKESLQFPVLKTLLIWILVDAYDIKKRTQQ